MWNEYDRRLVATTDAFNTATNALDDVGDALKLLTARLDNLEKKPVSALNYKNEIKIKNLKTLNYNYKFRI